MDSQGEGSRGILQQQVRLVHSLRHARHQLLVKDDVTATLFLFTTRSSVRDCFWIRRLDSREHITDDEARARDCEDREPDEADDT